MPAKQPMPSDDVLNALFERLIVSHASKVFPLGVTDQQHVKNYLSYVEGCILTELI